MSLTGPLADLTLRVAFDGYEPSTFEFAEVVGGSWGPLDLSSFSGRPRLKGSEVEVALHPKGAASPLDFMALRKYWNEPAIILLKDGTRLEAAFAYLASQHISLGTASGATVKLVLYNWQTGDPTNAAVWASIVEGASFNRGNLTVHRVRRRGPMQYHDSRHKNLRLNGRHTWHVLDRSPKSAVALFESPNRVLDREALSDDFIAMQFVFGAPCKIGFTIGFSDRGDVVAAAGLHFGFRPVKEAQGADGPIPDRFDTRERWLPIAFTALSQKMAEENASPLRIPLSAFLDAAGDHVDGAYMKIQVAMEAFCHALPKPAGATTLVKDNGAWLDWVDAHKDVIEAHATDASAAKKLMGKTGAAMQLPSTDAVEDGLAFLQINLPQGLRDEVRGRNRSVHLICLVSVDHRFLQSRLSRS